MRRLGSWCTFFFGLCGFVTWCNSTLENDVITERHVTLQEHDYNYYGREDTILAWKANGREKKKFETAIDNEIMTSNVEVEGKDQLNFSVTGSICYVTITSHVAPRYHNITSNSWTKKSVNFSEKLWLETFVRRWIAPLFTCANFPFIIPHIL